MCSPWLRSRLGGACFLVSVRLLRRGPTPGMFHCRNESAPLAAVQRQAADGPSGTILSFRRGYRVTIKPKYVNMADLNSPHPSGTGLPADDRGPARGGEPIWDIIELLFFAYRDFVADPDEVLAKARLRARAPSGAAFRQPQSGHEGRRSARYPEDHQAIARAGAQAADRPGLYRAERRRQRPPPAAALRHAERRSAGDEARRSADRRILRALDELGPDAHEAARRFPSPCSMPTAATTCCG